MIETIALIVFLVIALFGIGLAALGIMGTFAVLFGAILYDLITWSFTISLPTLGLLLFLAIIGEGAELLITYVTHKRSGASKYALIGTIVGAIIGAVLLSVVPVLGTLVGIALGGLFGAYLAEFWHTRNSDKSWTAAKASILSRGIVMLLKFTLALTQTAIVLRAIQ